MSKKSGKFVLAGLLGAVAGAVGGLLLAPQSGKKTREDIVKLAKDIEKKVKTETKEKSAMVKEVFGNASKEAVAKFEEIKSVVIEKVAAVKTAGNEIDKEKYGMIVDEVLAEFKSDLEASKGGVSKMAKQLKKDWQKMKKAIA